MSEVPGAIETIEAVRRSLGLEAMEDLSPEALIRVLRRNKFPLLSLVVDRQSAPQYGSIADGRDQAQAIVGSIARHVDDTRITPLLWSDEFATALSEDIALYTEAHGEYMRIVDAWSRAGIRCVCLKSAGLAPSFPYTSDNTDILVLPEHVAEARRVLLAHGYVELRNAEEPLKWLFRRFVAGRSVSAIHLHAQVGWGQGYMLEEDLWARTVRSRDDMWTWVPGREDAALINLAHAWVENKAISLHDLVKIRYALSDGEVDWQYMEHVATERGWREGLYFALLLVAYLEDRLFSDSVVPSDRREHCQQGLRATRWLYRYWNLLRQEPPTLPFPISFVVSKALHFQKLWSDRCLPVTEKPAQTILELARGVQQKTRIWPQNSMLIALSGADGSGKSTQARLLAQAFETSAIRCQITWARVGATPLLQTLHVLRHRYTRRQTAVNGMASLLIGKSTSPAHAFNRNGWRLTLWAVTSSAEFAAWLLYVRWRLLRGDVVIADRYLCDCEVELRIRLRQQPVTVEALLVLLRHIAPGPRRAYLLRIDPEHASQRTPPGVADIDPIDQCSAYEAIYRRYGLSVVDATLPLEDVSTALIHDALSSYMDGYNPLGNVLFFSSSWQLNPPSPQAHG